jgi:hypothetical protein
VLDADFAFGEVWANANVPDISYQGFPVVRSAANRSLAVRSKLHNSRPFGMDDWLRRRDAAGAMMRSSSMS